MGVLSPELLNVSTDCGGVRMGVDVDVGLVTADAETFEVWG